MTDPMIVPCGDDALRLVTGSTDDRQAFANALHDSGAWREVLIGRESITVQFDPAKLHPTRALQMLKDTAQTRVTASDTRAPRQVLTVQTDERNAPDLAMCAEINNCSIAGFLDRIQGSRLQVDMLGFAPGFAYVSGVDTALNGGRLSHPRQRVLAGSIGFIKGYLGIYGLNGPGGWPIIGRTDVTLFDKTARDPFLLSPGAELQIEWV
jgi:5-oxoprolinase (ATP-hydrolysing) subunit B